MNLISLQLKTSKDFDKNLSKLIKRIENSPKDSFILAPELYLTGYAYNRLDEASLFTKKAINILKFLSYSKIISLTMTTKKNNKYYNTLYVFHNGLIVHTQSKLKLFVLGDEKKHFTKGDKKDIKIIEINGIRIASLICFELRFIDLWKQIQGADIILIPAMWGKLRKEHYESLTRSLAISNQCYVMASDSANKYMAKSSAIISPFGDVTMDDTKKVISSIYNHKEIKKMRRYINTGIK